MSKRRSIQLKAAFLLLVFGLNTVIGFACSVGIDMGFNAKHHHADETTKAVVHIHKDGKKHVHHENKQSHSKSKYQDKKNHDSSKPDQDCCNDKVQQIEHTDKSVPGSLNIAHPLFFTASVDVFYNEMLPSVVFVKNSKQFFRSYHPPIPDVRVAIQSFQI